MLKRWTWLINSLNVSIICEVNIMNKSEFLILSSNKWH